MFFPEVAERLKRGINPSSFLPRYILVKDISRRTIDERVGYREDGAILEGSRAFRQGEISKN